MVDSVSEGGNGNGWLDQTRLEEKEDPIENGTQPKERKHSQILLSVFLNVGLLMLAEYL